MTDTLQGPRAQVRRLPDRGHYDEETVHAVLDAGFLCNIGFSVDNQPFVIPTLYARRGNTIFVHGSAASRMMRQLQTGIAACITVTHVDGFVLARSAFHHSMNYRSVVCFGTAKAVTEREEKMSALEAITNHIVPGRWDVVRIPNDQELKGTTVIAFTIEEASAKIRTGPPKDDAEDYALPVWAGVIPLQMVKGEPIPDPTTAP